MADRAASSATYVIREAIASAFSTGAIVRRARIRSNAGTNDRGILSPSSLPLSVRRLCSLVGSIIRGEKRIVQTTKARMHERMQARARERASERSGSRTLTRAA